MIAERRRSPTVRSLAIGRAVYGAGLLALGGGELPGSAEIRLDPDARLVVRLLGLRQLVQAGVLLAHPTPDWQRVGAGVDALHSASMVYLARRSWSASHRRLAARDAVAAGLLALVSVSVT